MNRVETQKNLVRKGNCPSRARRCKNCPIAVGRTEPRRRGGNACARTPTPGDVVVLMRESSSLRESWTITRCQHHGTYNFQRKPQSNSIANGSEFRTGKAHACRQPASIGVEKETRTPVRDDPPYAFATIQQLRYAILWQKVLECDMCGHSEPQLIR